jgi:hypothetical protein
MCCLDEAEEPAAEKADEPAADEADEPAAGKAEEPDMELKPAPRRMRKAIITPLLPILHAHIA